MNKKKEDSKLVPELRFSEFERGGLDSIYKKYSFTDIFLFSTGKNIKQREASPEFKIPCVRYGELYHMYNEVIYKTINRTNLESSELRFSKGNEILLPSAGEDPLDIGSASALTLANIAIGRTINILRPLKENVYSQIYVSYYINEKLRRKISTLAKGSSISNVYNSDLRKLEMPLPSLPEQQKIANTLTNLDDLIGAENEKLDALKAHKKGLLQQLFPAKGEKVPKVRFGEFDEDGEWEIRSIEKNIDLMSGIALKSKELTDDKSGTAILRGINITEGKIRHSQEMDKFYLGDSSNIERYLIEEKDIVIGMDGSKVGKNVALISKHDVGSILIQRVARIRAVDSDVEYLYQHFLSHGFRNYVDMVNTSSGIPHISAKQIRDYKIGFPPKIKEQQKIAKCLSSLDNLIEAKAEKIESLKAHKKGLMQQLFPNV